jgi:hypothetical protein
MQCQAINRDGKQCRAHALKGKQYCLMHDPESKNQLKDFARQGGLVKKKVQAYLSPIEFTGDIKEVLDLLVDTINRVRSNTMPARTANTIGYLANVMIKALEITEIDNRLKQVERVVMERKTYQ